MAGFCLPLDRGARPARLRKDSLWRRHHLQIRNRRVRRKRPILTVRVEIARVSVCNRYEATWECLTSWGSSDTYIV
jgi:hypothetical protein